MRRIVTILVAVVVAGLVGFLGIAALLPREVRVERQAVVSRPPCTMFAVLDGFGRFNDWSPWAERDPETAYTFDGPAHGVGASMAWTSAHPDVGSGTQRVIGVKTCERVDVALAFDGSESVSGYLLERVDAGTQVTWWMVSDMGNNPFSRYVGTQLDKWVGPDFERGLVKLGQYVQTLPEADFGDLRIEHVDVPEAMVAYAVTTSAKDPMALGTSLGTAYAHITRTITAVGLTQAGSPRAIYRFDGPGYSIDAMLPVVGNATSSLSPDDPVRLRKAYDGPALRTIHMGAYDGLQDNWEKLNAYVDVMQLHRASAPPWEEYVSDPAITVQGDLQTALVLPLMREAAAPDGPR